MMIFSSSFRFSSKAPVTPTEPSEISEPSGHSKTRVLKKAHRKFRWGRKYASSCVTIPKQTTLLQKTTNSSKELSTDSQFSHLPKWIQKASQGLATILEKRSGALDANKKNSKFQGMDSELGTLTVAENKDHSSLDMDTTEESTNLTSTNETCIFHGTMAEAAKEIPFLQCEQENSSTSSPGLHLQLPPSADSVFNSGDSIYERKKNQPYATNLSPISLASYESFNWNIDFHEVKDISECSISQSNYSESFDSPTDEAIIQTTEVSRLSHLEFSLGFLKELKLVKKLFGRIKRKNLHFGKHVKQQTKHSESRKFPACVYRVQARDPLARYAPTSNTVQSLYYRERHQTFRGEEEFFVTYKPIREYKVIRQIKERIEFFKENIRASRYARGCWLLKNKPKSPLWYVISLKNKAQRRAFGSNYSRNEDSSLFLEAMRKMRVSSALNTLVQTFDDEGDGSISMGFKKTISDIESFVNGPSTPMIAPIATFSRKTFKTFLSSDREMLDRTFSSFTRMCKQTVEELKLDPKVMNCREILEIFRQYFDFYRKHYAGAATIQIIDYVYEMAELRQETFTIFKTLCYLGNNYLRVLEYLSLYSSSVENLLASEAMLSVLITQITNTKSSLDKVQRAILQMKEGMIDYIVPMINLAHRAINIRTECSNVYREFCQTNMAKSLGMVTLNRSTNFIKLLDESEFLVCRKEFIEIDSFQDSLNDLKLWQEIVGDVQIELEINIWRIYNGMSETYSRIHQTISRSFNGSLDPDQWSLESFGSSTLNDEELESISADTLDMGMIQELEISLAFSS
ncbi:hypothetical protein JCM33374_g6331 [Metschnikowia sp. JCM 33374]|nr:hypothetical protein JCM33374_g6331 [Metschnikowia sp. JCM 33374]